MDDFISEQIIATGRTFDAGAMARGEPGLPEAFTWRGSTHHIVERVGQWKATSAEGARAGAEVYLRRHYYELRMADGQRWVVYFVRQTPKSGTPKARWFLYTIKAET